MAVDIQEKSANEPTFLKLKEAARLCRTSTDTIRRATLAGELKFFRLGQGRKRSPILFRRQEILRWVAARELESTAMLTIPKTN